jgi:phenylpyruvate tautomerase PptA (4-oxalocrotonate tautomerase family)
LLPLDREGSLARMPLIHVFTSAEPNPARVPEVLKSLSACLAQHLKKPERYVMTCFTPSPRMTFAGSSEPACYVEIKNIGNFAPALTQALSAAVCATLSQGLGVQRERIYIEFANAEPHLWGFDGQTFA